MQDFQHVEKALTCPHLPPRAILDSIISLAPFLPTNWTNGSENPGMGDHHESNRHPQGRTPGHRAGARLLEKLANGCVINKVLDAASARQAVDFFQNFADRCHHAKEEEHLFPALEAHGFSRAYGPTGVMLHEHEQGRRYLQGIAAAIDQAAAGDAAFQWRFTEQAWAYIELLRQHIAKENQRLFVMADERLTEDDQQALLDAFAAVEDEEMHAGIHEKYLQMADEMAQRF